MSIYFYETRVGKFAMAGDDQAVTHLFFSNDPLPEGQEIAETKILREAGRQLSEYLDGMRTAFTVPLAPGGTEYMRRIWELLCGIPYGETATYKEIAAQAGNPRASRAVGLANNRNPIPIFIPCHRVVGSNGKLVGYRGGLELKEQLLAWETEHKEVPSCHTLRSTEN